LLHSQFDALEEPGPNEDPIVVSIEPAPREIVEQVLSLMNVASSGVSGGSCTDPPGRRTPDVRGS
jgi:hypothetical protein